MLIDYRKNENFWNNLDYCQKEDSKGFKVDKNEKIRFLILLKLQYDSQKINSKSNPQAVSKLANFALKNKNMSSSQLNFANKKAALSNISPSPCQESFSLEMIS